MNNHRIKVEPTENPREWVLLEPIEFLGITVPAGFVTDGASVPLGLRWRFPHGGKKFFGAVLHDWLYRNNIGTRKWADQMFYLAMVSNGVSLHEAELIYWGVRLGGYRAWRWPQEIEIRNG